MNTFILMTKILSNLMAANSGMLPRVESQATIASLAAYDDSDISDPEEEQSKSPQLHSDVKAQENEGSRNASDNEVVPMEIDDSESSPSTTTGRISPISPGGHDDASLQEVSVNQLADHKPRSARKLRSRTGLVSYSTEKVEGDSESSGSEGEDEAGNLTKRDDIMFVDSPLTPEVGQALSQSVRNKSYGDIQLPPEPPGRCSKELQEKIAREYEKKLRGQNANILIQRRKDFRNPSIYEKLIDFCKIDEFGSNYPRDIFDPHGWGLESFYEELAKVQKAEMDKREKEKKDRTKIEFVTGVKKPTASDTAADELKKRKSKWDQANPAAVPLPGSKNPLVIGNAAGSVVSTTMGGGKTVIPSVGNLSKKK